jgi:hypothetical protein
LDAAQIPRTIVNERDHKIEDYYRNAPVANTDAKLALKPAGEFAVSRN